MKKLTKLFIVLDILVAICFIVVYAPIKPLEDLQNMIIATSIATKTHDYIAYTFWSEDRVNEIAQADKAIGISDDVNLEDVVINTDPVDSYDNEYDEQILKRDSGNDLYKYLKIKVGKTDAHLVAIYDPSKIKLMTIKSFGGSYCSEGNYSCGTESVLTMSKRLGAIVAINAGGFDDSTGYGSNIPLGYVIKDGKVKWSQNNKKASLVGFTNDNKLLLKKTTGNLAVTEDNYRDAIQFSPFLIINGKTNTTAKSGGSFSRAARVVIAQRKDGVVLFLVTEGTHTTGPTMKECIDTLLKYGAYNAANMDGGTSTQLVIKNKLINNPKNIYGQTVVGGRNVVTAWGLFEN